MTLFSKLLWIWAFDVFSLFYCYFTIFFFTVYGLLPVFCDYYSSLHFVYEHFMISLQRIIIILQLTYSIPFVDLWPLLDTFTSSLLSLILYDPFTLLKISLPSLHDLFMIPPRFLSDLFPIILRSLWSPFIPSRSIYDHFEISLRSLHDLFTVSYDLFTISL